MENVKIDISKIFDFIPEKDVLNIAENARIAAEALENKTGKGNDFLGWIDLPSSIREEDIRDIEAVAKTMQKDTDVVVVIGIGGSYLGSRAVAEALAPVFLHLKEKREKPVILFAGQNIGEDYLNELTEILDRLRYCIVVISKSGTTTEPAIAFRILKAHIEKKEGAENAKNRIIAITDAKRGSLYTLSKKEGYRTFVIPDDVGGRYSVLTPVGLVPLAIGGFDVRSLIKGASDMEKITSSTTATAQNPALLYAAARYLLYRSGRKIELLANFDNKLHFFAEWWKQLYGESEGKENKGIFPASVDFTADLHSMGQYIQQGERILFETVLSVGQPQSKFVIPGDRDNLDGLNYIAGKRIDEVNKMAELGTMLAHVDGGVPNIRISIPVIDAYYLGQLIFFFEKACGISGYLLGVNPFDQPGVEAYKKNMFALLEKPGYEEETRKIKGLIK